MSIPKHTILLFQKKILSWWEKNKRDLPWRHTSDPYRIFVSEVMLQQTQVSRVIPVYLKFLSTFPTPKALSRAKTSDVLRAWKGMGYNRRALYLKKSGEIIVHKYGGVFPKNEKVLLSLPGVGKYTSRAILVFAYRKYRSLIDTNIRKIITHFFFDDVSQKEKVIEDLARQLVPKGKSWEWHQALMDYGALALQGDMKRVLHGQETINSKHASTEKRSERGEQKTVRKNHTLPFRESDRFFRGRIIDALRERSWKERELKELIGSYGKDGDFFDRILVGLEKDGLVKRRKGIVTLP